MASDVDPRFDPVFQRGFEPVVEPVETTTPRLEPAETSLTEFPRLDPVETSPPRNPWIPILWITAAVFTIAGLVAQYTSIGISYSPTAPTAAQEYVLPTVLGSLAPTLFMAGLATAIATLVIHALRWQPRD